MFMIIKFFFNEYMNMRDDKEKMSANDLIEIPTLISMLPSLKNKTVLDLGCGSGNNCMKAIELGASYVLGTDISQNMINLAKERNNHKNIDYKLIPMEEINSINKKFDVVISSLAIHYVSDYEKLTKDIYELLNNDGLLIFSQEHPIGTGTILNEECKLGKKVILGDKEYVIVSDYNVNGERKVNWNIEGVIKYHRNFSCLINTLISAGFKIEEIIEPIPSEKVLEIKPKYINQFNVPYFIFIKVRK